MKKILLACCSCFVLFGGNAVADDEICYAINVGGSMEQGRCTDKELHDKCDPLGAPSNGGWCINTPDEYNKYACAAMTCNEGYLLWLTNTRQDSGRVIKAENNRKVGVQGLCFKKSDLEAKCKNACSNCPGETKECKLKEREVTVTYKPNGETSNIVKTSKAFIGEEACVCVDKENTEQPAVEPGKEECTYKFYVRCKDRTQIPDSIMSEYPKTISLTQKELRKQEYKQYELTNADIAQCKDKEKLNFDNSTLVQKLYKKDVKTVYDKLKQDADLANKVREFCKDHGGYDIYIYQSSGGGDVDAARKTVMDFFNYAKNNKTVWKTVDGKFNTARLASDLTAGVVLGTVGGVVSGVVIKKKQVEKGFDALHCAVGGQSIADWGDTFDVGLR